MPYTKEYYETNHEIILKKAKEYRESHKEEIKIRNQKYFQDNKPKIMESHRIWAKEKYKCPCGALFRKDRKTEHLATSDRHKDFVNNNEIVDDAFLAKYKMKW